MLNTEMFLDQIYQQVPLNIREQQRVITTKLRLRNMLKFHSHFISHNDIVFDIGANVGDYTAIYDKLGARVICLEPQPYCIKKLKERFINKDNITIVEKGVSDKEETILLSTDSKNHATATFSQKFKGQSSFNNREWDKDIPTQTTTLNRLIEEYGQPSYCKIDVEGYEYEVLKTLKHPIKYLSFEYTKSLPDEAEKCMDFLKTLGKSYFNFSICTRFTKLILPEWTNDKEFVLNEIRNHKRSFAGDIFVRFE